MTELIRTEDCYPRPGARTIDEALVARIANAMRLVGFLPSEPVLVRKSGNRFVIIDGQHRAEAAKLAGIDEVPAVIEDADEAFALTFEGVANIQRPDTDDERWQRAQDFFDFEDEGVRIEESLIAVATGLDPIAQRVVRRVRRRVNDPEAIRDQHSLDRILALDEFLDDAVAVGRILTAPESAWRRVVAELRQEAAGEDMEAPAASDAPESETGIAAIAAFIAEDVTRRPHLVALMDAEADALIGDLPVHGRTTRLAVAWLIRMARERGSDKEFARALKADGYES